MSARKFPISMTHGSPRTYGSVGEVIASAVGHSRNRILHACEAISIVGGLALKWRKNYTPTFTITGAKVQDATAGSGEQAAHVLVGQILIDGKPPWTLIGGETLKVALLARFMVTSAVPISFNAADSAAESAGLKEAFRSACERAWSQASSGQHNLIATYEQFLENADRAFQNAEHAKKLKAGSNDERLLESVIVRAYRVHGVTAKEANRMFPLKAFTA